MSWFSSGEGSKIHAKEFAHAMELLGNDVITKDLSINNTQYTNVNNSVNKEKNRRSSVLRELKSLVMVVIRFLRLIYYLILYKPELIIYRYSIYDISGILAAKLYKVPIVYEINGSIEYERNIANRFYLKQLVTASEQYIFNESNLVLLVSNELKRYFSNKNYYLENTLVVPNGVDMDKFTVNTTLPKEIESIKQLWSTKKVIGFLGSLKSWHGAERIIEIFPDILEKNKEVRYLIIGDGDRRAETESKIKQYNLQDYVYITGFQDYTIIPSILDVIDIAVAPYHTIDFFHFSPLKVMEYMAKGKPVVAPALGQCVDLIGHDHGILLKENTDACLTNSILTLVMDEHLARNMGIKARKFIEQNYTWKQNARRIEEALQGKRIRRPR